MLMHLGNRNPKAESQHLTFPTPSFQVFLCQLQSPFQTTDNVPELALEFQVLYLNLLYKHFSRFIFYRTFKIIFLLLSNPKRKKRFVVPPSPSLQPLLQTGTADGDLSPSSSQGKLISSRQISRLEISAQTEKIGLHKLVFCRTGLLRGLKWPLSRLGGVEALFKHFLPLWTIS